VLGQLAVIILVAAIFAESATTITFILSEFWNEIIGAAAGAGFIWLVARMFNRRENPHKKPPADAPHPIPQDMPRT
jgi:hypothetical protein